VSTVRYRTFKDLRLSRTSAGVLMLVLGGGLIIATQLHAAYVLVAYFFTYLGVGLVESAFLLRSRLVERRLAGGGLAAAALLGQEDEDDRDDEDGPDFL
jgi:CDP-diacylglycerol--serine O-phosphatidyltransferase